MCPMHYCELGASHTFSEVLAVCAVSATFARLWQVPAGVADVACSKGR